MFRIFQDGRVEGYGVAGAIGKAVDISIEISFTIQRFAPQHFSHRIGIGCGAVDVGTIGRAYGIGKKLPFCSAVGTGCHDISITGPVIPAEHAGSELAMGGPGFMLPGFPAPEVHDLFCQGIGGIIVLTVFGGLVPGHGLKLFMTLPVISERLNEFRHAADLFVEYQIFYSEKGIDGRGIRNGFQGGKIDFGAALGHIQALFLTPLDQAGQVWRGKKVGPNRFRGFVDAHAFFNDINCLFFV